MKKAIKVILKAPNEDWKTIDLCWGKEFPVPAVGIHIRSMGLANCKVDRVEYHLDQGLIIIHAS